MSTHASGSRFWGVLSAKCAEARLGWTKSVWAGEGVVAEMDFVGFLHMIPTRVRNGWEGKHEREITCRTCLCVYTLS